MLMEEHKKKRMGFPLDFLTRYAEAGDKFLDYIVTGDETCVYHHTPESKQKSMQWRHSNSPKAKKCKTSISAKKIMASVFWDRQGILLLEFMPLRTTINVAAYYQTLKRFQRTTQNKRRGMLTTGVRLLHDNARPHTALLKQFKWEPSAIQPGLCAHLFRYLKSHLGGKSFHDDDEIQDEVWRQPSMTVGYKSFCTDLTNVWITGVIVSKNYK
ncbi:transposase [Trichonephila clavipes]|nr:transposase [Trichonephila clavipes]